MSTLLWAVQLLGVLVYGASGIMKVFMFDKVTADVPSFGALPRPVWTALGIIELVCTTGLVIPGVLHWKAPLTAAAAAILALESLVFIYVHVRYREVPPIIVSGILGLLMAFVAYGRLVVSPF